MRNSYFLTERTSGWSKRGFDILFSLIILVLLSPMYFILAILVKLSSPGPIIFGQERLGRDGKRFTILKFRTMPVDVERSTGPVFADAGDTRATSIGRFLRSTSLDELPQFLNILKGEMSVVGPRPERPFFVSRFKNEIHAYMQRHQIRPGLTGWAQVNGWRGKTCIKERTLHDLHYVKNWSILFDFRIIIGTIYQEVILKIPSNTRYVANHLLNWAKNDESSYSLTLWQVTLRTKSEIAQNNTAAPEFSNIPWVMNRS